MKRSGWLIKRPKKLILPETKQHKMLCRHVDELLDLIADRIVTQYFAPYCVVDLARMGQALQMQDIGQAYL